MSLSRIGWSIGHEHAAACSAVKAIGIGGSLTAPPLPHHRTYGSVYGGSVDQLARRTAREGRPSEVRKAFGRAMWRAGLLLSRQGPCGLTAVRPARSARTPERRSSAERLLTRFHCFQAMARSRRLSHWSRSRNTDGVWQKPKYPRQPRR